MTDGYGTSASTTLVYEENSISNNEFRKRRWWEGKTMFLSILFAVPARARRRTSEVNKTLHWLTKIAVRPGGAINFNFHRFQSDPSGTTRPFKNFEISNPVSLSLKQSEFCLQDQQPFKDFKFPLQAFGRVLGI